MKIGFFKIFFNPQYNALNFKSALMVQWQGLVRSMKISFTLMKKNDVLLQETINCYCKQLQL